LAATNSRSAPGRKAALEAKPDFRIGLDACLP